MILMGCGTSLFACKFASLIFKQLNLFDTVEAVDASEMTMINVPRDNAGAIAVS
jgi:fructoselysine-6-P-deglycase FrlB-like protein